MITTPLTQKALAIAKNAHEKQFDKGGKPYVLHPIAVAEKMASESETVVALLHDVLEDAGDNWSEQRLLDEGFSEEIVYAVAALTRGPHESYNHYIDRVAENDLATRVKLEDINHNLDTSRLIAPLTKEDQLRVERYKKAQKRILKKRGII